MNNFKKEDGAATPQFLNRLQLKNAAKTKVNRLINFQLGLIVALALVYLAIEISTVEYEKEYTPATSKTMTLESTMGEYRIVENKPVQKKVTEPAKPKTVVKKFDISKAPVIDDTQPEVDMKELMDQLVPIDTGESDPVVDLPAVKTSSKNSSPATTHINGVMEVPLFPGCDPSLDRDDRIKCLNEKMTRFVQRKFDATQSGNLDTGSTVRITVVFTIGTNGLPMDLKIKAPNKQLEDEARRTINRLPEMTPGKNNGAAVNVTYVLPIVYKLN
jgi:protein TonB